MLAFVNNSLRASALAALAALLLASKFAAAADAPPQPLTDAQANDLLAAADAIRFPRESFQAEIIVANYRDGDLDEERRYRVLSRGNENTIVLTTEPASERGQALLMRGRDLWIYMPSVSQPIRLSLSQRLTGQVANGDLARANFAGDYNASYLRPDSREGRPVHVLELLAEGKGITYDRVHYWVDAETSQPVYAEFFARSGRLLKTMRYADFEMLAGALRPTRLVIDDALKAGRQSVLSYDSMALRDLPEQIFTRDYLRRLQ